MFKNDHKKPLFSRAESDAAIALSEILMNIADAENNGIDFVPAGYETLDLTDARIRAEEYREEFMAEVKKETQRQHPDMQEPKLAKEINRRAKDILKSLENTSHLSRG